MKIYLTGASGFIGSHLNYYLLKNSYNILASSRSSKHYKTIEHKNLKLIKLKNIDVETDYFRNIDNIDCFIHCEGITNNIYDNKKNSFEIYRKENVEKTKL